MLIPNEFFTLGLSLESEGQESPCLRDSPGYAR